MDIVRNFKRFRLIKGRAVEDLADYLGIDEKEYLSWEAGESEPTIQQLHALARYYDCSTDLLMDLF